MIDNNCVKHNLYSNLSIKWKLVLPIFSVLILLFLITQHLSSGYIEEISLDRIDKNLESSAKSTHTLINIALQESIHSYLKGRVEDSIYSLESIYSAIERGSVSRERGLQSARVGLLNRTIGDSGYFYVIDSKGTVIVHPQEELVGTDVSAYDFAQEQILNKTGYLQYRWQNPEDDFPRRKALYMSYFEPLDWIVTASIYRDEFSHLIDLNDLPPNFLNPENIDDEYKYICDKEGNIIYSPDKLGKNILEISGEEGISKMFTHRETENTASGITEYQWKDPGDTQLKLKRAYYTWLPELDWCIVSTYDMEAQQKATYTLIQYTNRSNLLLMAISLILLYMLTGQITRPLSRLTTKLIREAELHENSDFKPKTKDEVQITELALLVYTRKLLEEREKVEETNRMNRILARFPNDAQFPILRMNTQKEVTFANHAAKTFLCPLLNIPTEKIAHPLFAEIYSESKKNKQIEKIIMGTTFHIFLTQIENEQEVYLHFYDLTTEKEYRTLQSIWQNVFESSIEGITITDTQANILKVNNSFTRVTGYSVEEAIGKNTRILRSEKHEPAFYKNMWNALLEEGAWEGEIWNRRKSGELYLEWLSISSFIDSQTQEKKFMGIFHDISDIYQKDEELAFANSHDLLTSLPNRNLFYDRLKQALLAAKRTGDYSAVITLDIHGFSMINDHMGQIWGDEYLKRISEYLQRVVRNEDTLARLGSDDFAILLPRLQKKDQCMDFLYRLWGFLQHPLILNDQKVNIVVNIGISFYPDDADDAETLIKNASLAMLKSKADKPGSHHFYDKSLDHDLRERYKTELALKQAIEKEEFFLMYQPKGDLETGELLGFEALVRWEQPERGMVSPDEFIPILEETGMINEVGELIFREACRFAKEVNSGRESALHTGINLSGRQFEEPGFVEKIDTIMKEEGVSPEWIDLEITESITATGTEGTVEILKQLQSRNFSISIDDFGTGYSSLQYLNDLPFDTIKIDRSFIATLPKDKKRLSIVRSIIGISKNYGKQTIAEGIETEEQKQLLKSEGCNMIQGYFYSRPLLKDKALDFINKNT